MKRQTGAIMHGHPSIGILGFGRFGKLMAKYLSPDFAVRVYDPAATGQAIASVGAEPVAFETAARCNVLVLAVPISDFRDVLDQVRPHLVPGSLVVDVCSVKEDPLQWMAARLPESVSILGTHPMFGPDSAAESLQGRKIVLCPVRIDPARCAAVRRYLNAKGLLVIETSPSAHDRQIAVSLALTHFIGRSLAEMGASPLDIDTEGYQRLLRILEVVENDSWQLFADMNRYNRFARQARRRFQQAMQDVERRLELVS